MPRFYCPAPLQTGMVLDLSPGPARHVQVLRMQPGQTISLFNHGPGWDWGLQALPPAGEFEAEILLMGRSQVQVRVGAHSARECEAARSVSIAVVMPANERMDWLVEKATELGVAAIYPLTSERSVVRLNAERAEKKIAHWQSVAIAACEQCGANRVPLVHPVQSLPHFLRDGRQPDVVDEVQAAVRLLLSLQPGSIPLRVWGGMGTSQPVVFLSGPEGGFSSAEEALAMEAGFTPQSLGARILRAETAALAALALLV
jgi:16S rRNA (uracil1498-N3)-methyltransferase